MKHDIDSFLQRKKEEKSVLDRVDLTTLLREIGALQASREIIVKIGNQYGVSIPELHLRWIRAGKPDLRHPKYAFWIEETAKSLKV